MSLPDEDLPPKGLIKDEVSDIIDDSEIMGNKKQNAMFPSVTSEEIK